MNNSEKIIEMRHIVKDYNGFKANNDMNLTLHKGEILALLGENGAGKSTLMGILSGLIPPTSGEIKIRGKSTKISNPNHAKKLGIGMVHQHFMLAQSFSVLENIILGTEPHKGLFLNTKKAQEQVKALADHYNFVIDLNAKIKDITVAQQQKIEILKVLYRGADVLIFDEPTAVLTPQEITEFLKIIKNLAAEGKSIILITHKLDEIKAVADKVTVIRSGHDVGTFFVNEISEKNLAKLMVGHDVQIYIAKHKISQGHTILDVQNLTVKENRGNYAIKDFSFQVKAGQILGIAGIDGNGQDELVEAITGLRHVDSGRVFINGSNMTNQSVRKITDFGVSTIPADRQKYGLVLPMSISENLALRSYHKKPFSKNGIMNFNIMYDHARKMIKEFDIRTSSELLASEELSGGNQQKVVIARELERDSNLIIAFQPTRGLDVGAIEYVHKKLLKERDKGKAILLISYELSEVMQLSDNILILHNGQANGFVCPEHTNKTEIGLMMTGIKKEGMAVD